MKKNLKKKVLALSTISLFFVQVLYFVAEPSVATALTTDDVVVTLTVTAGFAISDANGGNPVAMSPDIGITSRQSIGGTSWTVTSNSVSGYDLNLTASTSPALKNMVMVGDPGVLTLIDSFDEYSPVGVPDAWGGVATGDKEFGFSGYGGDIAAAYNNGIAFASNCGVGGVPATDLFFDGFNSTNPKLFATSSTITPTGGTTTNICFAAEQGLTTFAKSGAYTATITGTVTAHS